MAVGDKLRLTSQGSLYGVSCFNLFNYVVVGDSGGVTNKQAVVEAFEADVLPAWKASVSSDFIFHCLVGELLGPGPAAPYAKALPPGTIGELTSPALPANRVMCVSLYSANTTRNGRGRKYLSGIPIADEEDNALSTSIFNLLQVLGDAVAANLTGAAAFDATPVVRSSGLIGDSDIVAQISSAQVRTLRGRTPRLC